MLDCSQMDARNPFITQRVVLAVRALTSGHAANQELLSNLKKLGAADSNLLRELGMERDIEGNITLPAGYTIICTPLHSTCLTMY